MLELLEITEVELDSERVDVRDGSDREKTDGVGMLIDSNLRKLGEGVLDEVWDVNDDSDVVLLTGVGESEEETEEVFEEYDEDEEDEEVIGGWIKVDWEDWK